MMGPIAITVELCAIAPMKNTPSPPAAAREVHPLYLHVRRCSKFIAWLRHFAQTP